MKQNTVKLVQDPLQGGAAATVQVEHVLSVSTFTLAT